MHRGIAAACTVFATALILCACASTAPVAKSTPEAKNSRSATAGFRAVNRNGEQIYCKRELLTGSRTQSTETCLTRSQLDAQEKNTEDFMRRVQDMSNGQPATDGGGGQFNNVMTSSGRAN